MNKRLNVRFPFELSEGKKKKKPQTLPLCVETIFPCVPNGLLRFEVTDSEGESLRFGWVLEVCEDVGQKSIGSGAQQEAMLPWGGDCDHATPQGWDRQAEPHRVNMMVTLAGTSLIYFHCYILVEMPDLWVWRECVFGSQWGGYSSTNVFQW